MASTRVHVVGYGGERCVPTLEARSNIHQHLLGTPFSTWPRSLFLVYAPLKVVWQVVQLAWVLLVGIPSPRAILVQNPPSIPTLAVVWLVCLLRGSRMVIDWHNFGYTILGLSLGARHPLVWVSRVYESLCSRRASAHLCVTDAMRVWLEREWGVKASLFYDRPPPAFKPLSLRERHDLFLRLDPLLQKNPPAISTGGGGKGGGGKRAASKGPSSSSSSSSSSGKAGVQGSSTTTLVTSMSPDSGEVALLPTRPAVLVSSTSWTADEDFGMLLDALVALDAHISSPKHRGDFPDFLVLVTGKGPLRAAFEARFPTLGLQRVTIRTLWLSPEDYPRILGASDCGVSLHASSSGLDLPMKVVDMFGAGLPVCALGFPCLGELVRHGENGLIFNTGGELTRHLITLFEGFLQPGGGRGGAKGGNHLARLRRGVLEGQESRWQENWEEVAAPLFS
jgi:beta-1,4-mannosyltransferase